MEEISHKDSRLFVVTDKYGISSYRWLPKKTMQTSWRRKVTPEDMRAKTILSFDQKGIRKFLDAPNSYVGNLFYYPSDSDPKENMLIESVVSRVHGYLDMAHKAVEEREIHAHAGALVF